MVSGLSTPLPRSGLTTPASLGPRSGLFTPARPALAGSRKVAMNTTVASFRAACDRLDDTRGSRSPLAPSAP
eukprot:11476511-Alexandrium_andersonii.AAC.1